MVISHMNTKVVKIKVYKNSIKIIKCMSIIIEQFYKSIHTELSIKKFICAFVKSKNLKSAFK